VISLLVAVADLRELDAGAVSHGHALGGVEGYNGVVSKKTALGWRLFWGLVGGALAFVIVDTTTELELVVIAGIAAAAAVATALVGPALLEVLGLA
jgi:hypothetical protein